MTKTEIEQIYRAYFGDVYRYICRLSGDAHLAEEITGETFFKAMRALDHFRGDCDIRVWLCQIAKNGYYSYLKKSKRTQTVDDESLAELTSPESTPEDETLQRDEADRIKRALHTLQDPYKEVFLWRVYADMSFRQIGQIFGKTENWACVTYHRARTMVKNKMEDEDNEK